MSERAASAGRRAAIAIVGALLVLQMGRSRPFAFAPPPTPVANTRILPREFRDFVDFLTRTRPAVPRGARVAVLSASARTPMDDYMNYLVAIGQLPGTRVEYPQWRWSPGTPPSPLPDYVAAFGELVPDPRFATVARSSLGSLWRRRP